MVHTQLLHLQIRFIIITTINHQINWSDMV